MVFAIACSVVVATLVWRRMRHGARVGLGVLDAAHMKRVVSGALGMLNCAVRWEKDDGNYIGTYQYQSGRFRLDVQNAEPYVRLLYPFFYETELDYIETVSYTHLRAHETKAKLVCRLLLEKKKKYN